MWAADVVLAFFTEAAELERRLDRLGAMVFPAGGLWIAWPKRTSGVATDLTDHAVRALGAATRPGRRRQSLCRGRDLDRIAIGLETELRGAPGPPEHPVEAT